MAANSISGWYSSLLW